jgi:hypothetical protein
MMDKAAHKAREIAMHNAGQIIWKQQWSNIPTANQLTDYCQSLADIQWELAQHLVHPQVMLPKRRENVEECLMMETTLVNGSENWLESM